LTNQPPQRVSAITSPDEYLPPSRPPESAGPQVQDAYRQTRFVLGSDLELFADAMSLQLGLVKDAHPSKYRTHALAALMTLWSRSYAYLSDAALLISRGSYGSSLPLFRAAAEAIGAEEGLRVEEMEMHHEWLSHALVPDDKYKAYDFNLGRYFAGGVIASDPVLRSVYKPAADLGRPAFGASLLQVAPESNNNRLAIAFADASFHLGWAELTLGWLLALSGRQLRVVVDAEAIFPVSDERRGQYEAIQRRIDEALARADRCSIEELRGEEGPSYLVHNFRRASGGALKKIVL
jgi:hypothetical protein